MSLFLFPFAAFFLWNNISLHPPARFLFALHSLSFHISFFTPSLLSPVLPLILRLSTFLPVLLALLTGFSKWPSEAAGSPPGAFGDLPGRHMPLSTLSSSACPPLLLLLYTFESLFFSTPLFIHPPPLPPSAYFTYLPSSLFSISSLVSLSPPTHIFSSLIALFLQNLSCSKITVRSFLNIILSKPKLGFHEAKL